MSDFGLQCSGPPREDGQGWGHGNLQWAGEASIRRKEAFLVPRLQFAPLLIDCLPLVRGFFPPIASLVDSSLFLPLYFSSQHVDSRHTGSSPSRQASKSAPRHAAARHSPKHPRKSCSSDIVSLRLRRPIPFWSNFWDRRCNGRLRHLACLVTSASGTTSLVHRSPNVTAARALQVVHPALPAH